MRNRDSVSPLVEGMDSECGVVGEELRAVVSATAWDHGLQEIDGIEAGI